MSVFFRGFSPENWIFTTIHAGGARAVFSTSSGVYTIVAMGAKLFSLARPTSWKFRLAMVNKFTVLLLPRIQLFSICRYSGKGYGFSLHW